MNLEEIKGAISELSKEDIEEVIQFSTELCDTLEDPEEDDES